MGIDFLVKVHNNNIKPNQVLVSELPKHLVGGRTYISNFDAGRQIFDVRQILLLWPYVSASLTFFQNLSISIYFLSE